MKRFMFVLLALLFASTGTFAQWNWDILWTLTYGEADDEWIGAMAPGTSGGFLLAGRTQAANGNGFDIRLTRIDSAGQILGSTYCGGSGDESVQTAVRAPGDGWVVAGYTTGSGNGGRDVYLIGVAFSGEILWSQTIGGTGNDAADAMITADGGYAIAGYFTPETGGAYDAYLAKTSASGAVEWSSTFGTEGTELASGIARTSDGGYLIAGQSRVDANSDWNVFVARADADGNELWTRVYDEAGDQGATGILALPDGHFAVAGWSATTYGDWDAYVVNISDADGDTLWTRRYGGTGCQGAYDIVAAPNGGFTLTGYTDAEGAGLYDVLLLQADANGEPVCVKTFGGPYNDWGSALLPAADGLIIGGRMGTADGHSDAYVVRTSCLHPEASVFLTPGDSQIEMITYPNPFNPSTTIQFELASAGETELAVYDISGRMVQSLLAEPLEAGPHAVTFEAQHLPSGTYYARLQNSGVSQIHKLLLVK